MRKIFVLAIALTSCATTKQVDRSRSERTDEAYEIVGDKSFVFAGEVPQQRDSLLRREPLAVFVDGSGLVRFCERGIVITSTPANGGFSAADAAKIAASLKEISEVDARASRESVPVKRDFGLIESVNDRGTGSWLKISYTSDPTRKATPRSAVILDVTNFNRASDGLPWTPSIRRGGFTLDPAEAAALAAILESAPRVAEVARRKSESIRAAERRVFESK